jgi:hypothetical protein
MVIVFLIGRRMHVGSVSVEKETIGMMFLLLFIICQWGQLLLSDLSRYLGDQSLLVKSPKALDQRVSFVFIFHHLLCNLILDKNAMNRLPLGGAVKDVSAANNRFNVIFALTF